jgi:hypothetical protein
MSKNEEGFIGCIDQLHNCITGLHEGLLALHERIRVLENASPEVSVRLNSLTGTIAKEGVHPNPRK